MTNATSISPNASFCRKHPSQHRNGAKYGTHPVEELRDKPLDPLQPCEEQDDQEPPASDPSEEEEKPRSKPAATLKNAVRAILSNPELSKIIYYDDFLRRPMTGD